MVLIHGSPLNNVYDTGATPDANLHMHHELPYTPLSTRSIAFFALKACEGKGYTYVTDGLEQTKWLIGTDFGKKLKEKGLCLVRCMADGNEYATDSWEGLIEEKIDEFVFRVSIAPKFKLISAPKILLLY